MRKLNDRKKYHNIILDDLGQEFDYIFKEGWDYYVFIVNNSIVYRFPKIERKIEELKKEKDILDILKGYVSINIPNPKIIGGVGLKYKIIHGDTMEKINLDNLDENSLNNFLDDIVLFLKELHGVPVNKFDFLKTQEVNLNFYRDKFKNEMDFRLKGKIDNVYIQKLKLYIDDLFALNFEKNVLVHSDIQSKNMIFDYNENKISGIIDFTDCRLSGRENDFVHFVDWGETLFKKVITKYLGFYDEDFVKIVKFLHKKPIIFEIMNDDIYENNFQYLLKKIKIF